MSRAPKKPFAKGRGALSKQGFREICAPSQEHELQIVDPNAVDQMDLGDTREKEDAS
jgi:hypothetical protein